MVRNVLLSIGLLVLPALVQAQKYTDAEGRLRVALARQAGGTVVVALLVNGKLAVFRDTARAAVLDLATDTGAVLPIGRYLARGADGNTIHVLTHDASLLTIRLQPLAIIARQKFADHRWRSLARAANGDLYLFAKAAPGLAIRHVDQNGRALHDWKVPLDSTGVLDERPLDWAIYQGDVSADGGRLYVSYHGSNTTGIDWFDLRADSVTRCPTRPRTWIGCVGGHGGFAEYKGGLLFATGFEVIGWTDGRKAPRGYDTRQLRGHLMEFAVDSARGRLYSIGSCSDAQSSYSVVDLNTPGEFPEFGPTGRRLWSTDPAKPLLFREFRRSEVVCGQRILTGDDALLYVIRNEHAVPFDQSGSILVLDAATGDVRRTLRLPSEAVDVLVLR